MKPSCSRFFLTLLVALLFLMSESKYSANPLPGSMIPLRGSRQCLLVITPSWSSTRGILTVFTRGADDATWIQRGGKIPVVLGKNGLAWGRGLASVQGFHGSVKKEGDERAPAGIFRLSSAFGYAPAAEARDIKLPYVAITSQSEAIDDPASRYYNQLVERSRIPVPDWRSSEKMRRADNVYRWGVVVDHNTPPTKGAGSCIFLHVWRGPASVTAGCTAMAEHNLKALIAWLDPPDNPVLVQLPFEEFVRLRSDWQLP
jgi:L,D-peptidoglycan transpeptidase YkuD (ErfK/YbiS/YcfS/YnhG family)